MKVFLERGHIKDGIYLKLIYHMDDEGKVVCAALNETQLAAFSDFVHESAKYFPKHGNSLRIETSTETQLWNEFAETILICGECGGKDDLKFNPYFNGWLCEQHQKGIEE